MPEGGVAQAVAEADGLHQALVKLDCPGNGAGNLRDPQGAHARERGRGGGGGRGQGGSPGPAGWRRMRGEGALIGGGGLNPRAEPNTDPSAACTLSRSWSRPQGSTTDDEGSSPIRAVPMM